MPLYPVPSVKNAVQALVWSALAVVLGTLLFAAEASASETAAPESLTLRESVQHGLENNPNLQAAAYEIKKSESNVGQAKSRFLPRLSTSWKQQSLESIEAEGPTETDYLDQDFYFGYLLT